MYVNLYCRCIGERCFCLCRDCDRVFHKAVQKRTHFRVPLALSEPSLDPAFLERMPKDLQALLEAVVIGDRVSGEGLCLLLQAVKALLDDRRVR